MIVIAGPPESGPGCAVAITAWSSQSRSCGGRVPLARMLSMALTAEDILPLVASLTPQERVRLLRLIARPVGADASVYQSLPPSRDEFSTEEEPLAWEAEGWEDLG